ncbi:MAG: aminotransferase class III-fold pyridoxal phosphate-dependent enzyme [Woeseiaceae bacterium]|nr:aminotransferase class III-fold pyridoxal phosphate-dependent enzyme [Woeseiaceae bacterium]
MRSLKRSNAHFRKAIDKLPLGVSSNFRYWGDEKTIYVSRGKGGRVWDIDGNEYIDYRLAYGPIILGYADERVDAAAKSGMPVGGVFALSTEREYEVACRIGRMVPAAELVRFSNSGTEAVMAALRVARAYTGKDAHVVVEGGYHGVFNEVLWYSEIEDWDPADGDPPIMPFSDGVPAVTKRLYYTVPLNDPDALRELLQKHHKDIGAFLIEPIMGNCCGITATQDYFEEVRELCNRYDVVLIVDEVKTGFRVARGGAQELYGIRGDICTFAKAMGNGYPIAVVAGREDIMRHFGDGVVHGGTFTGHSVSLAATDKTLEILDETTALEDIAAYGRKLQAGISRILEARDITHSFAGHPALMGLFFAESPPSDYRGWLNSDYAFYDALAPKLHEEGVLVEPDSREPWFLCEAHTKDCLDDTLTRFERAVDRTLADASRERAAS